MYTVNARWYYEYGKVTKVTVSYDSFSDMYFNIFKLISYAKNHDMQVFVDAVNSENDPIFWGVNDTLFNECYIEHIPENQTIKL